MNYERLNRILFSALLLGSTYSYGQVWGVNNSRTEFRDNAGLQGNAGAISGFFQTPNPINYPAGAAGWWHLLDVRHDNAGNNYAMQFAGSFYDQNLYFRKTNDNASQNWSKILVETDGKVSIGRPNANSKLHIFSNYNGNVTASLKLFYEGSWGTASYASNYRFLDIASTEGGNILQVSGYGIGVGGFAPPNFNSPDKLYVNGNVGIGTADAKGYKLAVAGNAIAESVTVKLQGQWGDYVFKPTYKLRPLSEVKAFINQNQHLPEIPSAREIEKSGIDLGEMVKIQTKKIEELTLYLIESNKQLQQQQAISKQQAKTLHELRQSINLLKAQTKK